MFLKEGGWIFKKSTEIQKDNGDEKIAISILKNGRATINIKINEKALGFVGWLDKFPSRLKDTFYPPKMEVLIGEQGDGCNDEIVELGESISDIISGHLHLSTTTS